MVWPARTGDRTSNPAPTGRSGRRSVVLVIAGVAVGASLAGSCLRSARHAWGGPTVALEVGESREIALADHETWAIYVRGGERWSDSAITCRVIDADGDEIFGPAADESVFDTLGGADLAHHGLGHTWRRLEMFRPSQFTDAATVTVTCPAPPRDAGSGLPRSSPPAPPDAYALGPGPDGMRALALAGLGGLLFLTCSLSGVVAAARSARRCSRPRRHG